MSAEGKGRPLPKIGEWDVNNPASAEGFSAIFNQARDEKKSGWTTTGVGVAAGGGGGESRQKYDRDDKFKFSSKRKWFCCG